MFFHICVKEYVDITFIHTYKNLLYKIIIVCIGLCTFQKVTKFIMVIHFTMIPDIEMKIYLK